MEKIFGGAAKMRVCRAAAEVARRLAGASLVRRMTGMVLGLQRGVCARDRRMSGQQESSGPADVPEIGYEMAAVMQLFTDDV